MMARMGPNERFLILSHHLNVLFIVFRYSIMNLTSIIEQTKSKQKQIE